jgi:hypothetical protein
MPTHASSSDGRCHHPSKLFAAHTAARKRQRMAERRGVSPGGRINLRLKDTRPSATRSSDRNASHVPKAARANLTSFADRARPAMLMVRS